VQATLPRYTGGYPMAPPIWGMRPVAAGHCRRCGEPSGSCCCGCRECRKEPKELLVTPGAAVTGQEGAPATGSSFVGGSCCVSLSVEYAPTTPTTTFGVEVGIVDSEGTTMIWRRTEAAGTGYRIKECVITTKPGAKLAVIASNCTVRVRWCEVFSC
jgi:hypothetical protein